MSQYIFSNSFINRCHSSVRLQSYILSTCIQKHLPITSYFSFSFSLLNIHPAFASNDTWTDTFLNVNLNVLQLLCRSKVDSHGRQSSCQLQPMITPIDSRNLALTGLELGKVDHFVSGFFWVKLPLASNSDLNIFVLSHV